MGVRINAAAAARAATGVPRTTRSLAPRAVNLGAGAASKALAPTRGLVRSGGGTAQAAAQPRIPSPTLEQKVATSFPGIAESGTCVCEPPDPWIAVSPTYVVQSTNGMVRVSSRAGAQLVSMPTWALFATPADRSDADPRILWDQVHGRWVGVITTYNDPDFTTNGLRLAVSESADPTAAWIVYPIETFNYLPDYPGISSSADKIVLSSDDYQDGATFAGPTLYVADWANILAGTSLFIGVDYYDTSQAHFRPAQMLSSASNVPVIYEAGSGTPGYVEVSGSAHAVTYPVGSDLNAEFSSALFTVPVLQPVQPGAVSIAHASDERPTDAVYRSGHLWFVATGDYFDGVDHWTAARYTEVDTTNNGVAPSAASDLITQSASHYFMPGIGVSGNGSAFLFATQTDGDRYPTSVVALVVPGVGVADYVPIEASTEAYTNSQGRWGDYVGVAADPSYSGAVWVAHELVATGGGWRTSVARLVSDATPPGAPGVMSQAQVIPSTQAGTVSVRTSWGAAADPGSGIRGYLVERSDDGGVSWFGGETAGTFVTQPLAVGHQYRYRISAVDAAGNVGGPTYGGLYRPTLYQSNLTSTVYTTGWGSSSSTVYSGGSTKYSSTAGKYATFTATLARSISIVATKAWSRGSFKVYVDGIYKATISTYSTTTRYRQLVYQFSWSAPGTHKVKIVVSGTSHHPRVDLDAFVVLR